MQAIIFDMDGTIADTERQAHLPAFNRAFDKYGLDWYWDDDLYSQLLEVTGGKERLHYYIHHYHNDFIPPNNITINEFIKQLHGAKTQFFSELVAGGHVALRPGILRVIKQAMGSDVRLAIATTTTLSNVNAILGCHLSTEQIAAFEVIGAGEMVANKKPAPDIYQYALTKLKLEAKDCLALEDSAPGQLSALAAKIPTLITANSYSATADFDPRLLIVDHLGDEGTALTVRQNPLGIEIPARLDLNNLKIIQQLLA